MKKNPQTLTNANMYDTNCLTSTCSLVGQSFQHGLLKSKVFEWVEAPFWRAGKKTQLKILLVLMSCVASFPIRSSQHVNLKWFENIGALSFLSLSPSWNRILPFPPLTALWMKAVTLRGYGQESVWVASGWTGAAVPPHPPCVSPFLYTAARLVHCGSAQNLKLSQRIQTRK